MDLTEFVLGGTAAAIAGILTNPLEVAKTRMQLQGELAGRGQYQVHYKTVLHAFYNIGKNEGILALQKGLVPAVYYQFVMNGCRLGAYQCFTNTGLNKKADGSISFTRSVTAGGISGCIGAALGSPLYLVKTHLQNQAAHVIAVGHQHNHDSMSQALVKIYDQSGVRGLWRGVSGAIPRVMVGSSSQLATFSISKDWIDRNNIYPNGTWQNTLLATCLCSIVVTFFMTPFDVVSVRLYNQKVTAAGHGTLYSGFVDCVQKILVKEGPLGFYKGWTAVFLRLAPHTVFSLLLWDELRKFYFGFVNLQKTG
ncbi:Solute carrier family 25 member 35 [Hypsibius exemplaris]|uniref:Solute carrier family 25 member 35 n=1 Tax=Hypsibius exemplaris TaxID=2072580 RepID=A0A1W0XFN5_HYPEX|nr:Solute carrier family 25 member 35 [Hypsibius exemplaris]